MKVGDVMNRNLEFIEPNATVKEAICKMVEKKIRSLVVLPKDSDDVHGVITVRDIVFGVFANGLKASDVKVEEIASKPIVCVPKNTSVQDVLRLMKRFNIARVFVIDDGKPIGLVSLMDLLKVLDD